MTLEKENEKLTEQVEQLTRERDHARAHADSRALGALQILAQDYTVPPLVLQFDSTSMKGEPEGELDINPMVLNPDQVHGVFEALKKKFEELKDWSILKKYEDESRGACARLKAEESNRDLWQGKAEKADARLKVYAEMVEGVVKMERATLGQIQVVLGNIGLVLEADNAPIEIRCACWYRARLDEMRRQLHVAVEEANPTTVVPIDDDGTYGDKFKAEVLRQRSIAATFAPELSRLSDAVDSMDRYNYATLVGVIPGGSTDHVAQTIASDQGVDETPNGGLGSSAQQSSE